MEEILIKNTLAALTEAFPEVMAVTEQVRQGFQAPCFRLSAKKCAVRKEMGGRYRAEAEFSLRFYPEIEDAVAAAAMPGRVEAALQRCPGFCGLESGDGGDGTVQMKLRFSAVGFWSGEPNALMEKMGLRLDFGAGGTVSLEKTGG